MADSKATTKDKPASQTTSDTAPETAPEAATAGTNSVVESHPSVTQVQGAAEAGSEEAETVSVSNAPNLTNAAAAVEEGAERCWNCAAQGVKDVPKLVKGICKKCGFDLSKVYNLDLLSRQRSRDGKSA